MGDSDAQKNRLNFYKRLLSRFEGTPKFARISPVPTLRNDLQCDPESLKRAAQFFELDLTHPNDFTVLVNLLAEILFGERPRGRKAGNKTWDRHKLCSLGASYLNLKSKNSKLSDGKIAELISQEEEFKEYRNHSEELRKRLLESQRHFEISMTMILRGQMKRHGLSKLANSKLDEKWTEGHFKGFAPRYIGHYVTAVAKTKDAKDA